MVRPTLFERQDRIISVDLRRRDRRALADAFTHDADNWGIPNSRGRTLGSMSRKQLDMDRCHIHNNTILTLDGPGSCWYRSHLPRD
jgi:hypothetical protein